MSLRRRRELHMYDRSIQNRASLSAGESSITKVIETSPNVEFPQSLSLEMIRAGSERHLPGIVGKEIAMTAVNMHTPAGGGGTSNRRSSCVH
jgi:hypothetical protein